MNIPEHLKEHNVLGVKASRGERSTAMVTVVCGNSISALSQIAPITGGEWATWTPAAEIALSNMLAGAPMQFKRITSTARTDIYGVYGYPGITLAALTSDLTTQWFAPLAAAGVIPDLVVGHALLENDLGGTVDQMKAALTEWIVTIQNTWPGVIIHLVCPRPRFDLTTPTSVANYQAMISYYLSLDDNRSIYVSRADAYEDPANPGKPKSTAFVGSISATTLTVTSVSGSIPLGIGQVVTGVGVPANSYIQAKGTGTGGAGTYILTTTSTVASTAMTAAVYTDALVHPNPRGALLLARSQAATLNRIGANWKQPVLKTSSANISLNGTGAAYGTNVTGSLPFSVSVLGSAAGAFVVTALQPGFSEQVTAAAAATPVNLGWTNFGDSAIPGGANTQVGAYIILELVSGASNLSGFQISPRYVDALGVANWQHIISVGSYDAEQDWIDGDVLTIRQPPVKSVSASNLASVNLYMYPFIKLAGGTTTFKVRSQGVGVVVA